MRGELWYLDSLILRLWSISQRTCFLEHQWQWWMAAPLSLSISPLRESTGWKGCWDTKSVWAWHQFFRQRGVLACIRTYSAVISQAVYIHRRREHSCLKSPCCRCAKGKEKLIYLQYTVGGRLSIWGSLGFMYISILGQVRRELLKRVYWLALLTALRFTSQRNLGADKVNPFRWC